MTEYLAAKTITAKIPRSLVITSVSGCTKSNKDVESFPENDHEGADTLMICLVVSATKQNSVDDFSSDRDVLILAIANYDMLSKNTVILMASSVLQIQPFWDILGPMQKHYLHSLHSLVLTKLEDLKEWMKQHSSRSSLKLRRISLKL